jgi:hypothetical protein
VKLEQSYGDFTVTECQAVMKYLYLNGTSDKKIYGISVTLHDECPSYSKVKKWDAGLKVVHWRQRAQSLQTAAVQTSRQTF